MRLHLALGLVLLASALFLVTTEARAEVRLASVFGEHMVLQREMPIRVWGRADPGEEVEVRLAGRSARTTADTEGRWRVELPPRKAGGPHELVVRGGDAEPIRVRDVLIGEVWLCSGQSNMAWTVARSSNAKQEIRDAQDGGIRHLAIPRRHAGSPQEELAARWEVCSPECAGRFTACGYYMARELRSALRVPIGLINTSWGGTRIEPWTAPSGFANAPALADIARQVEEAAGRESTGPGRPCVLYNGMVHALVGFSLRGALWYQGEANRRDGSIYTEKQKALIGSWRELWGLGDFPFYFVQIAPFRYPADAPEVLPAFWEAQAAVLEAVPNTGMVVTNDIGTLDNIHPPNKQEVGRRLALLALHRTYGKAVQDSGPAFRSMEIDDGRLRLRFDHADGGLRSRDGKPLTHFEIAGATTGFVAADAKIDGDTVVLRAPSVDQPIAMRFAWHKCAEPNLVNRAGLPATAFRAGDFPRPDFLESIEEASAYTLVYDLDLSRLSALPAYDVDARATVTGAFDRVAWLLELQAAGAPARFVWVSTEAFTDDLSHIGIPTLASGAHFQQAVLGLTVTSNVEGLSVGSGLEGHLEFWPNNYGPENGAEVQHASAEVWDFGDQPSPGVDGYGSMQVHLPAAKQTLFAINRWKGGGDGADLGIGNSTLAPRSTDWTFARNGGTWIHKRLRVFVRSR